MSTKKLQQLLIKNFPFDPTKQQAEVMGQLSEFVEESSSQSLFLLKGYAGTGKTSLISALINSLWSVGKKVVLLAPTGRAAKVLSSYSNKPAFTIHKKIYWVKSNSQGNTYVSLQENKHTNTIFIVDEASMIPDAADNGFSGRVLLDDLMDYVFSGSLCKLILVGDTAQLPPVHLDISPALNENLLGLNYKKDVYGNELSEVVRQQSDSSVLKNATLLRENIKKEQFSFPELVIKNEVIRLDIGMDIQDALESAYANEGVEDTVIICRSNKRANLYNQQIRLRIRGHEEEISTGDFLMVVRNNYFWLPTSSKAGFIANGDTVEVMRIYEINDLYNCRFARISARLVDYPNQEPIECIVILNTLSSDTASMTYEEYKSLYNEVAQDYQDIPNGVKRRKEIKSNPFLNALQVKYAYAITCHKSQGGQWGNVFIDQGYFIEDMLNKEYLRWLYTAMTRTKNKLFLINFKKEFFNE
ncbi:MAG: ATP-dependent DNA helicase [Flavobacteriales bacterium]